MFSRIIRIVYISILILLIMSIFNLSAVFAEINIFSEKYKISDNYIECIYAKTIVGNLLNNLLVNDGEKILVYDNDIVVNTDDYIHTGMVLNSANDRYKLVVIGDLNGDGNISAADLSLQLQKIVKVTNLEEVYYKAGDLNNDGNITAVDVARLKMFLVGLIDNLAGNEIESNTNNEEVNEIKIEVNNKELTVKLEDNTSTKALVERLKSGNIIVNAKEYGNFEKVGDLGFTLPRNDKNILTKAGDIVLYQGNQLSLFYNSNSWSYTKLGEVTNVSEQELKDILGDGDVVLVLKK